MTGLSGKPAYSCFDSFHGEMWPNAGNIMAIKQNMAKCTNLWPFYEHPICPEPVWKPSIIGWPDFPGSLSTRKCAGLRVGKSNRNLYQESAAWKQVRQVEMIWVSQVSRQVHPRTRLPCVCLRLIQFETGVYTHVRDLLAYQQPSFQNKHAYQ